jgi:hypothetical protein
MGGARRFLMPRTKQPRGKLWGTKKVFGKSVMVNDRVERTEKYRKARNARKRARKERAKA